MGGRCFRTLLLVAAAVFCCLPGPASATEEENGPARISSRAATLLIDSIDSIYKADVQGSTTVTVPIRIGGNQQANLAQLSVDFDQEKLLFRELKIEDRRWLLWPGTPVALDPDGRVLATLIRNGADPESPPPTGGHHFVSLVFDIRPGALDIENYRLVAPLSFTTYDPESLTQDPREETMAGVLDLGDDEAQIQVLESHLGDGGITVFYADGIEVGGGGLTQREQSFSLPLYITHLGEIETINVGVDYDELILNLLGVRLLAPTVEGAQPREPVAITYRSNPSGADFRIDVSLFRDAGTDVLLRAHVADLEFHYAGSMAGGDGAGQGAPANFMDGRIVVQPSVTNLIGEGQAAGNQGLGIKLLPGYLRGLNAYFVRGNVDSSMLDYRPPEDGALIAREDFRTAPNLGDSVAILRWLFAPEPSRQTITCMEAADTDNDGYIQIDDAVLLLTNLFIGGENPASPFPYPGTEDEGSTTDLGCEVPLPVFIGD